MLYIQAENANCERNEIENKMIPVSKEILKQILKGRFSCRSLEAGENM